MAKVDTTVTATIGVPRSALWQWLIPGAFYTELDTVLREYGLEAPPEQVGWHRFVVSDDQARFLQVGSRFVGERLGSAEVVAVG